MGLLKQWRHKLESSNVNPGTNVPPEQQQAQTAPETPNQDPSQPGQPTEQVGTVPEDKSVSNPDPSVAPATTPEADPPEQEESYLTRLTAAAANLTPSEIPSPADIPALVGVLLFEHDNGEFPAPLHERFPDQFPDPDKL